MLIATGTTNLSRPLSGYGGQDNLLYLRDMQEHQMLKEQLKSIKKLVIYKIYILFF